MRDQRAPHAHQASRAAPATAPHRTLFGLRMAGARIFSSGQSSGRYVCATEAATKPGGSVSEQSSAAIPQTQGTTAHERSALGKVALGLVALSAVGFVLLMVGDIAGWNGFTEGDENSSAAGDLSWFTFSIGAIVALITGVVAWVRGRRAHRDGDVRAGQIAVGYFVFAVIAVAIVSSVT